MCSIKEEFINTIYIEGKVCDSPYKYIKYPAIKTMRLCITTYVIPNSGERVGITKALLPIEKGC